MCAHCGQPEPSLAELLRTGGARLDDLYGQFVVDMQRTGDTKEALRQILLAAGTNQPGGQPGLSSAQAALREAAHEMLCCFYFRFPEEQSDSLPGTKFARAAERLEEVLDETKP
jgi:hypothetical protein